MHPKPKLHWKGRPEVGLRTQRRRYQQRVGSLLEAIDERHRHQLALAARGVTPMGMGDLKREIQALRDELAAVIAAGSDAAEKNDPLQELPTRRLAESRRRLRVSRPVRLRPVARVHFPAHS
jgi:hypothetical protein